MSFSSAVCALAWLISTLGLWASDPARPATKLRVVCSFLPLQSHAAAIAGELAEVEQLLTKDAAPHESQLTPHHVARLVRADLFIINGIGMEDWIRRDLLKEAAPNLRVVDTSVGLSLRTSPARLLDDVAHRHASAQDACGAHGKNPHVWLDPQLARQQANVILQALQSADPRNHDAYAANARIYDLQLLALHHEFAAVLKPLPRRNLVTLHDAFPYLASRYELNYVGYVAEFPEKDPTPQELARLVTVIRSTQTGVLFAEEGYASGLLRDIARQTGAHVASLDTLEIGQGGSSVYCQRMRANLVKLKEAFGEPLR